MSKPKIGFTAPTYFDPLSFAIALSVRLAGGAPIALTSKKPRYEEDIDGLILSGGIDIFPSHYEAEPKPLYRYDRGRDTLDMKWFEKADKTDMPLLGICRGTQVMNVARGGSLHLDVTKIHEEKAYPTHFLAYALYRKTIFVEPNTRLQTLMKRKMLRVNSMHKQAIDRIGSGYVVSSKEDNGIVQSIEDPSKKFFLGVQFHPELLIYRKPFRSLFEALIKACQKS